MQPQKSSNVFIKLIKIGLIVYTMIRSIDLVQSTLPDNLKTFGIAVVFGLDVALLAWDDFTASPHKARSEAQHNVGVLMIVANMLGIGAAMIADSARIVDPVGSQSLIYVVSIYGIPIVVLGNIVGLVAVNQLDPDRAESQAAAEHARKLARMRADHDRKLALAEAETELGVNEFRNMQTLRQARKRYFIDDDGDGKPDREVSLDDIKARPMVAMASEGEEVEHTSPKAKRTRAK